MKAKWFETWCSECRELLFRDMARYEGLCIKLKMNSIHCTSKRDCYREFRMKIYKKYYKDDEATGEACEAQ